MAKCEICNKSVHFGNKIRTGRSHVTKRVKVMQKPNIQKVRVPYKGNSKKMSVCTKCLRNMGAHKIRT